MKSTTEFINDLSNNYMILCPQEQEDSFALKMLVRNKIDGLLKVEIKTVNNTKKYYYDITDRQPVSEMIEKQPVSFLQLQSIYKQILKLPDVLKEFLLPENSILMNPEFIYADADMERIEFCCYPGVHKPLQEQIGEFTEYLLNKVDYRDEKAVLAVYALYQVSHDKNCTLDKLKEVFQEQCRKEMEIKESEAKANGKTEKTAEEGIKKELYEYKNKKYNQNIPTEIKQTNKKEATENLDVRIKRIVPETTEAAQEKGKKKNELDFSYMEERMENQKEVLKYPPAVYGKAAVVLVTGFCVLFLLFQTGILNVNGKPDLTRYSAAVVCCLFIEGAAFCFIFQKKNKCAKIEEKLNYFDWEDEYELSGVLYEDAVEGYYQDAFLKETGNSCLKNGRENEAKEWEQGQDISEKADEEDTEAATELLVDFRDHSIAYLESEFSGERIYLKKFPFLIGKLKKGTDYILDNNKISRIHARLDYDESRYYIEDMDSTNGTSLNGVMLAAHDRQVLSDMDRVCFADKNFVFHC